MEKTKIKTNRSGNSEAVFSTKKRRQQTKPIPAKVCPWKFVV